MNIKRFLSASLAAIIAALGMTCVNASATPVAGGKTVFTAADFKLDYDSVNGNGAFKAYRIDMSVENVDGKDVVKMTAQNEAKQGLIDFSYYQYNNTEYLPALKTTDYPFLIIKYKRAVATKADFAFFKANEAELGKTDKNANFSFKADSTDWATVIIDLSTQASLNWNEKNIRQFRLYPWGMVNANTYAGETIYIEYFGFFKTEADAKAYGTVKPAEATESKPAEPTAAQTSGTTAPQTADPIALTVLIAAASIGGVFAFKRYMQINSLFD